MTRRRPLVVLATVPVALGILGAGDWQMPDTLASDPGPVLSACNGDAGGLAPMRYRYTYADGTASEWLPMEVAAEPRAVKIVSQSVRDGLGKTRTVDC